jgi:hypothetical protein
VNIRETGEEQSQAQYMRELRLRHQEELALEYGRGRHALVRCSCIVLY